MKPMTREVWSIVNIYNLYSNLFRFVGIELSPSTRAFLDLLKELRKIFLQDAVLLREIYPNFEIWSHELFSSDLFAEFEINQRVNESTLNGLFHLTSF